MKTKKELEKEIKRLSRCLARATSALCIIRTWATFRYEDKPPGHALTPENVVYLCDDAFYEIEKWKPK